MVILWGVIQSTVNFGLFLTNNVEDGIISKDYS